MNRRGFFGMLAALASMVGLGAVGKAKSKGMENPDLPHFWLPAQPAGVVTIGRDCATRFVYRGVEMDLIRTNSFTQAFVVTENGHTETHIRLSVSGIVRHKPGQTSQDVGFLLAEQQHPVVYQFRGSVPICGVETKPTSVRTIGMDAFMFRVEWAGEFIEREAMLNA